MSKLIEGAFFDWVSAAAIGLAVLVTVIVLRIRYPRVLQRMLVPLAACCIFGLAAFVGLNIRTLWISREPNAPSDDLPNILAVAIMFIGLLLVGLVRGHGLSVLLSWRKNKKHREPHQER